MSNSFPGYPYRSGIRRNLPLSGIPFAGSRSSSRSNGRHEGGQHQSNPLPLTGARSSSQSNGRHEGGQHQSESVLDTSHSEQPVFDISSSRNSDQHLLDSQPGCSTWADGVFTRNVPYRMQQQRRVGYGIVPSRRRMSSASFHSKRPKVQCIKTYTRDVMCLPKELISENESKISIPRGEFRKELCERGLMGKVALSSDMSPEEICQEICSVFSDSVDGDEFAFTYLQSSGGGTKSLCVPKISSKFKWNAQQVAALGRNSCIYILADVSVKQLVISDYQLNYEPDDTLLSDSALSQQSDAGEDSLDGSGFQHALCSAIVDVQPGTTSHGSSSLNRSLRSEDDGQKIASGSSSFSPSTATADVPTRHQLYEMFPNLMQSAIDLLCELHAPEDVADIILSDEPHLAVISALQRKTLDQEEYKVKVDEDDLLADVIALYKMKKFSLKQPIRVTFSGQPGVDAGGIRRQFFSDAIEKFAFSKKLLLFDGPPTRLHPRLNPQALLSGLFKVLGRIVGHAILLEGIGFPYLSPCLYWYLATSSEQVASEYIEVKDDVGSGTNNVVQKIDSAEMANINSLSSDEAVIDVMSKAGITTRLSVNTRNVIAQDILLYDAVLQHIPALTQFGEGLKEAGLLDIIRELPHFFECLFVKSTLHMVDAKAVKQIMTGPMKVLNESEGMALTHFETFIDDSNNITELKNLVHFVTGSGSVIGNSFFVDISSDGEFHASTCSNTIWIPLNLDYSSFQSALRAVMNGSGSKSFTTI